MIAYPDPLPVIEQLILWLGQTLASSSVIVCLYLCIFAWSMASMANHVFTQNQNVQFTLLTDHRCAIRLMLSIDLQIDYEPSDEVCQLTGTSPHRWSWLLWLGGVLEQEGLRGCFRFARLHLLKNKSAAHTGPQFHLVAAAKKALFCDITSACLDVLLGKGVQILFIYFLPTMAAC